MTVEDFWAAPSDMTNPEPVTDAMVAAAQKAVGYTLPAAYVELLRAQNGGAPKCTAFPTDTATSWAEDHVAISGICGIGGKWGIDSPTLGSRFMIEEWGYPDIGVVVAQCPSAGHDAVMLDYSECGKAGQPRVIHVEVEAAAEPVITVLAPSFEAFAAGLVDADEFDDPVDDFARELQGVLKGRFTPLLKELVSRATFLPGAQRVVRRVATGIVLEKGHFALHADEASHLMMDLEFWLYSRVLGVPDWASYEKQYVKILVVGAPFSTGGFARGFVHDWRDKRLEEGHIVTAADGSLSFTSQYEEDLKQRLLDLPPIPPEDLKKKKKPAKKKPAKKKTAKKKSTKKKSTKKKSTKKKR